MTLLVLGGTADARRVADALHGRGLALIYSVAGLVRLPQLPCQVVSGGFTQFGGLPRYIEQQGISAILDITHPFAQQMSANAVAAAKACSIPCWRFHRRPWQQQTGDRWQLFSDWRDLIPALADKRSVFLSAGQLTQEWLDALAQLPAETTESAVGLGSNQEGRSRRFILRTAVQPKVILPANMDWIQAIGPFSESDERALMTGYQIDALVSKNSGGDATVAKLTVARQLGIPVLMLQRPSLPAADEAFSDEAQCVNWVVQWYQERSTEKYADRHG